MALLTTKAIVFNAVKYGDSSLIVKCFTANKGIKTYVVHGVLSSKKTRLKPAYFQPLTQIQLVENQKNINNLYTIKEAGVTYHYQTIYNDVVKQSMVLFLSEVLSKIIKEEEQNSLLYQYIESSLIWLDTHNAVANFHLLFLLNLSNHLGIYPNISQSQKQGFHLLEGKFTNLTDGKNIISAQKLTCFKRLLSITFDQLQTITFRREERIQTLQILLRYFELHLEGFTTPKSLTVLAKVFS